MGRPSNDSNWQTLFSAPRQSEVIPGQRLVSDLLARHTVLATMSCIEDLVAVVLIVFITCQLHELGLMLTVLPLELPMKARLRRRSM
jgi:hypothetical protein